VRTLRANKSKHISLNMLNGQMISSGETLRRRVASRTLVARHADHFSAPQLLSAYDAGEFTSSRSSCKSLFDIGFVLSRLSQQCELSS
jgi:hypothetical protein